MVSSTKLRGWRSVSGAVAGAAEKFRHGAAALAASHSLWFQALSFFFVENEFNNLPLVWNIRVVSWVESAWTRITVP